MKTILKTTDPVRLSYATHLLDEAGIEYFVADQHVSAIEGSIGVFPRRVMVIEDDEAIARSALLPLLELDPE